MKVAVFGATGGTGQCLLEQALAQNHTVTAFVRNPSALLQFHDRLRVCTGDVLDAAAVSSAVAGQHAVLSALGVRTLFRHVTVLSEGTQNIVSAMQQQGVSRFVCQSSFGVGESYRRADFLSRLMFRQVLGRIYQDKARQEEIIRHSALDWTIVHPPRLTNGPHRGKYRSGQDMRLTVGDTISRADVADFMLAQLGSTEWLRKTVAVTW